MLDINSECYCMTLTDNIDVLIDKLDEENLRIRFINLDESYTTVAQTINATSIDEELIKNWAINFITTNYNKEVKFLSFQKIEPAYYSSN
jgi:hypothetical protein